MKKVGKIGYIRRYPVKSMMGEDLKEAQVLRTGLVGDRIYAFIDDRNEDKEFPWMTARQLNEFLLFKPRFVSSSKSSAQDVLVECPDGREFSVRDRAFESYLEEKYKCEISLKHDETGCFDSRPISLFGLQTVKRLQEETAIDELSHIRFRANFYADWDNKKPFYEDELVGKNLQLGDQVRIGIVKRTRGALFQTLTRKQASPHQRFY